MNDLSPELDVQAEIVKRLRSIHTLKAASLAMSATLLPVVARERDASETPPEVAELLGRMHGAFSGHRAETADHARRIEGRLADLGAGTASRRDAAAALGARSWAKLGDVGGQNHGSNARNAFVFEHLEVAGENLLEQLALRSGDEETAQLARACIADDEGMAATINGNWTNVLTLNRA